MGMTRAQVWAVMSCAPIEPTPADLSADYSVVAVDDTGSVLAPWCWGEHWVNNGKWIYVIYEGGKVQYKTFSVYLPTWKDTARRWFPWLCQRVGI
jgi:hypothetical protein